MSAGDNPSKMDQADRNETVISLNTRTLGLVQVSSADFLEFPEGLLGFQDDTRYIILPDTGADSPFEWLQSVEKADLAFILIKPELVFDDNYQPRVAAADLQALQVQQASDCQVYTIVTIPKNDPRNMTANLQGPILVNVERRLGRQIISLDDNHPLRAPILEQMEQDEC
ncbi:MAG: flagellar assembly protein FliW [Leptospiraceae bacterium]|nr:flagellar assembly protein FliW [Leptospiraceae bacterium]